MMFYFVVKGTTNHKSMMQDGAFATANIAGSGPVHRISSISETHRFANILFEYMEYKEQKRTRSVSEMVYHSLVRCWCYRASRSVFYKSCHTVHTAELTLEVLLL